MPDQFQYNVPAHKLSPSEFVRAFRENIIAEMTATNTYEQLADAAAVAGRTDLVDLLRDLANEERVHVGELLLLIDKFDKEEQIFISEGFTEAKRKLEGAE